MNKFYTCILAVTLMLSSCSVTRHLPADEQLYTGIKEIEFIGEKEHAGGETGQKAIEEVTYALDCAPNGSIFGSSTLKFFPMSVWWHYRYKDSKSKFGKWMFDTFAKNPVLISTVKPELRADVASEILKYYGYFNGKVESEVITNKKNPKKAAVSYKVTFGKPCYIDSIEYRGFHGVSDSLVRATTAERLIHSGEQFNAAAMEEERNRLNTLFRNNGYYYYQPGYINYLADTINNPGKASVRVQPVKNLAPQVSKQWYIGNVSMRITDGNMGIGANRTKADTITRRNFSYIYYGKKLPVRIGALLRNMQIRGGELYSQQKQQNTLQRLSQMGIFKGVSFNIKEREGTDTLDMNISAQLEKPYDLTFELNATSKSNDQIGPGTKISIARRNVFRGGETLKLTLKGSYEWQTDKNVKGRSAVINSWEMGADLSLTFPRLFFPIIHRRHLRVPSSTSMRLFINQMNRSGFFKMVRSGGEVTYKVYTKNTTTHTITPFRLAYDMLQRTTAKFDSIAAGNRSIANSFRNQFIPAMQYTFLYDNASTRHRNKTWFEASVTSAGNVTSLAFSAFGQRFGEKNKNILGNPYAQFIKGTAELRQLWKINNSHHIATRIMIGAIHSYGNSEYAPYSEQFYVGGANSLRAFTVRSVGPGSYKPDENDRYSYLDETGTLKFEMNAEYRFRLISDLHGALFVDAGNVWLMKKEEDRPGGEFKLSTFPKQLALNTGFGFRYDLEFLVLRVDFGLGLHAPYKTGKSGYFNLNPFGNGFAWHFAIGYPF